MADYEPELLAKDKRSPRERKDSLRPNGLKHSKLPKKPTAKKEQTQTSKPLENVVSETEIELATKVNDTVKVFKGYFMTVTPIDFKAPNMNRYLKDPTFQKKIFEKFKSDYKEDFSFCFDKYIYTLRAKQEPDRFISPENAAKILEESNSSGIWGSLIKKKDQIWDPKKITKTEKHVTTILSNCLTDNRYYLQVHSAYKELTNRELRLDFAEKIKTIHEDIEKSKLKPEKKNRNGIESA